MDMNTIGMMVSVLTTPDLVPIKAWPPFEVSIRFRSFCDKCPEFQGETLNSGIGTALQWNSHLRQHQCHFASTTMQLCLLSVSVFLNAILKARTEPWLGLPVRVACEPESLSKTAVLKAEIVPTTQSSLSLLMLSHRPAKLEYSEWNFPFQYLVPPLLDSGDAHSLNEAGWLATKEGGSCTAECMIPARSLGHAQAGSMAVDEYLDGCHGGDQIRRGMF
ncbi:hypothetical protein B0H14DRAFT_2633019 [Mycena olivaceomarginata]|nr:hypothetical protein B0H14DRAFT_2633019 [Mycena olivaceomarginata]